jgi:hypothetical protein
MRVEILGLDSVNELVKLDFYMEVLYRPVDPQGRPLFKKEGAVDKFVTVKVGFRLCSYEIIGLSFVSYAMMC